MVFFGCSLLFSSTRADVVSTLDSTGVEGLIDSSWQIDTKNWRSRKYAIRAMEQSTKLNLKVPLASAYNRLGIICMKNGNSLDSADYYFQLALELRKKYGSPSSVASVYNNMALLQKNQGFLDQAEETYAIAMSEMGVEKPSKTLIRLLRNRAVNLRHLGRYEKALEVLLADQLLCEQLGDLEELGWVLLDMSTVYGRVGLYGQQTKSAKTALDIFSKLNKAPALLKAHLACGNALLHLNKLDSAEKYYRYGLQMCASVSIDLQVKFQGNLGKVHYYRKDYKKAILVLKKGLDLDIRDQVEDASIISITLAKVYTDLNLPDSSIKYLKRSNGALIWMNYQRKTEYYSLLERNYMMLNQLDSAYQNRQAYQVVVDSLDEIERRARNLDRENERLIAQLKLAETDEQLELARRRRKNMEYIITVVMAVVVIFGLVILLWVSKNRKRLALAEKEQELNKKRLAIAEQEQEIHKGKVNELLKNQELISIMNVIEMQEKERTRIARDLHDRLGGMLSMVKLHFMNSDRNIDALKTQNKEEYAKAASLLDEACDEVRRIAHDMESGVLKNFGLKAALNDLKETIDSSNHLYMEVITSGLDERLSWENELNIYRIVQELLANTLKHAQASEVTVQLLRKNGDLVMVFEDDGRGFDPDNINSGMGLKNVESRLAHINGDYNLDSGRGGGTTYTFRIPLNQST